MICWITKKENANNVLMFLAMFLGKENVKPSVEMGSWWGRRNVMMETCKQLTDVLQIARLNI
jgi:hypothetical protein